MAMPATQTRHLPKTVFQVGKFHPPGQRKAGNSSLFFLPDQPRLELSIPSPSAKELKQFRQGELHIALVQHGAAIVLLHRFGNLPWRTAVCDADGLGPHKRRVFQALARERHAPFQFSTVLLDRDSKTVLACRAATLSPVFAAQIGKAMRAKDANAPAPETQAEDLDWLMTQHPGDLLSLARIYERALCDAEATG